LASRQVSKKNYMKKEIKQTKKTKTANELKKEYKYLLKEIDNNNKKLFKELSFQTIEKINKIEVNNLINTNINLLLLLKIKIKEQL
jgi:hypothetical protein